jgi:DNA-binding transcriptional regulator YhcF (GntR family)
MKLSIDRDLPVPLGVQLRGLIEYGIACGELQAGEQLPSIRELADSIGVAPMTISQVYRDLKKAGLIEAQAGSGTFVADNSHVSRSAGSGAAALSRRIDALIEDALAVGLRPGDLVSLFNAHVFHRASRAPLAQLVMVGMFQAATARYARLIARQLGAAASVDAVTLDALAGDQDLRRRAASADLAVTFVNRHREVEALLPGTPVVAVSFIPSEETRLALASIDPLAKVGAVSLFPEFLPIMCSGVQRFAPHVENVSAAVLGEPEVEPLLEAVGVVVYATGAEAVLDRLKPGTPAIEYRHIPDPADIERVIAPVIRDRRAASAPLKKEAS